MPPSSNKKKLSPPKAKNHRCEDKRQVVGPYTSEEVGSTPAAATTLRKIMASIIAFPNTQAERMKKFVADAQREMAKRIVIELLKQARHLAEKYGVSLK